MSTITYEEIVRNIQAQKKDLSELRSVMDRARRLPEQSAISLASTGMFRLLTPNTIGGPELSPLAFFETLELIALSNPSAAWCSMISSTNGLNAAYLPLHTSREIFGDPNVITGGVFAPKGKAIDKGNHYLVSGRWAWGSGSANCAWLGGGCTVWKDGDMVKSAQGGPEIRMMLFLAADAELIDSWHVMGLRGTGSGDFEVKDIRVPKTHSVSFLSDRPRETGALYKFPVFGLLALGISGVAVGNGRAAIDTLMAHATGKSLPNGKTFADKAFLQTALAEIEADWQASRSFLVQELSRAWDIAQTQDAIPVKARAALRLACTKATRTNAHLCQRIFELGGGDALFERHDFERYFRDGAAMTQHIMTGAGTYEMVGRVMLDRPINASMI